MCKESMASESTCKMIATGFLAPPSLVCTAVMPAVHFHAATNTQQPRAGLTPLMTSV